MTASAEAELRRLLDIMAALRHPETGCPWDKVQDFATIAPYTIEEAYEVADAIARRDLAALPDELGDLLFQVVYHARMAEEAGLFGFAEIARTIADKMVRRHPHVFGDEDVRMTAHHLVGNGTGDLGEAEQASFLGHARVIDDLEQQIAKLVGQGSKIAPRD